MEKRDNGSRALTKRYLRQIERSWTCARMIRDELTRLEKQETFIGSQNLTGDRVQHSTSPDAPFVHAIEKRADLEAKLRKSVIRHDEIRMQIINELQDLEKAEHIDFLKLRYVEGLSMNQISRIMKYSLDRVNHIHLEALDSFYMAHRGAVESVHRIR